jgi:hypothetical protein
MPDPKMYLDITGTVTADTSGGYTRFTSSGPIAGPLARFVGVETSQIQPGSNANTSAGGFAHAVVPILSRLAISEYPELPPPLAFASNSGVHLPQAGQTVAPRVIVTPLNQTGPLGPHLLGYRLTDGTALTAIEEDGQVVGLSGKSANQHCYSLTTSLTTVQASGRRTTLPKVTWLVANLRISKDGAVPFTFGFSYAAEAFLFNVHSFCGNVVNRILVDLAASVVEKQTGNIYGTATLTRNFEYYSDSYCSQNLVVPATTPDARFHLANQATLWPLLPDVALFANAFAQLGGKEPEGVQSPFVALGSLNDFEPPPALSAISEQITSSIIPACGTLAASCLSSDDSAVGLKAAAIWLAGLLLSTGSGKTAVQTAAQAYYNTQYAHRFNDSTSPGPMSGADFKPDPVVMEG